MAAGKALTSKALSGLLSEANCGVWVCVRLGVSGRTLGVFRPMGVTFSYLIYLLQSLWLMEQLLLKMA